MTADAVCGHLADDAGSDGQQTLALDVHEVAPDVQVHGVAWQRPVVTLLAYVHRQTLDAVVRASALDAAVGVLDESSFKERMTVVEVEMVNDTIPKERSEYLPLLGVVDDESTWTVGPYSDVSTVHRTARSCSA